MDDAKQDSIISQFCDMVEKTEVEDGKPVSVAILIHDGPDPDAIGGAIALRHILSSHVKRQTETTIIYGGEISHPLNKTMVNVLGIQMTHVKDVGPIETPPFHHFVCVDCVPSRTVYKDYEFSLVVDHHRNDTKETKLKDIRPVGSVCSILWEYMTELGIELDRNDEEEAIVATAMSVGIKIDTSDFVSDNVTDLDFDAYKGLLGSINLRNMSNIVNFPIPPYHFELRKMLDQEGNVCIENGVFIGGIGYISRAKRDAIPVIAEERARQEGIDTAVIFAIVGNDIQASVRSNSLSIDVNTLCQNIFGRDFAGGKQGAGAAKIAMGFLGVEDEDEEHREKMWEAVRDLIIARILEEMSNHR